MNCEEINELQTTTKLDPESRSQEVTRDPEGVPNFGNRFDGSATEAAT
jgi:hypothetical protein